MMTNVKRDYNFDAMRVVICLFVIAIHANLVNVFEKNILFKEMLNIVLFQCNNLFYMISGYYNLDSTFKDINDYKRYYKNKFITIFLPYLVVTFILSLWDLYRDDGVLNIGNILLGFYKSLMNKNAEIHLWFMYPLIGILLATPFLSKMLNAMNDMELKLLFYIAFGWNIISIYFCKDFGVPFKYSGWIFDGWIINYFMGYYYKRIVSKESIKKWIFIALIGYIITLAGKTFIPNNFKNPTDLSIAFILFCIGCFMFWHKIVKINAKIIQSIIVWLSKYTFYIYMFHWHILASLRARLPETESMAGYIILIIVTFMCSLILSILVYFIIKPIQNIIKSKI